MTDAGTDTLEDRKPPPPYLVGLAQWALPGLGYWLIGDRARGTTIGVAVVTLFVLGLLIGGVRVVEVPTFSRTGVRIPQQPTESSLSYVLRDVGNKPWSVPQVMAGPVAIAGGVASVWAGQTPEGANEARGAESHARINEIAVLYTAVAGMLNVLAIIDSAYRAHKLAEPEAEGK